MAEGNGGHVTRAELAAHIRRIDENLTLIDQRLQGLENRWQGARVWVTGRATAMFDRFMPVGVAALVTYLITH